MLDTTRLRLYPTKQQTQALTVQFGCARWVWNDSLSTSRELYRETGKSMNYRAMSIRLPLLKQTLEWLKDADSQVLQHSIQHLAHAFERYFTKVGRYPRFKSKHGRQSIQYPQRVKINSGRIYLPKVGWVKCIIHRELIGGIKTVTITRQPCGHFHASILMDTATPLPSTSMLGKAIGIDMGLAHLAITSDGSKFNNPHHLSKAQRNLKRKQQSMSRKKKGSNNRKKARRLIARIHQRVADARKDYIHKISRRIVNENQVIAVETLNTEGMIKNHKLARAISGAGWGMLTRFVEYKAARAGKAFVQCDRWFPSSKACSTCGFVCDKMPLEVRVWACTKCHAIHDRDINAAINIRDEGLRILAGGVPASASRGNVSRGARRESGTNAIADETGSLIHQAAHETVAPACSGL